MAAQSTWKPHESLTQAPTNLKEAIDWVLRVTGRDGKENKAAPAQAPASSSNGPHCLCFLAKAVKDLLYDAKDPGSPGPSSERYWDGILLEQESDIVNPVLTDLGLLNGGSTDSTTASTTCAGGTEVIKALIYQLAQGLQKWVGWQEGDTCCLGQTKGGKSDGIGKGCERTGSGVGGKCCTNDDKNSHECYQCGKVTAPKKCYLSAYCKKSSSSGASQSDGDYYWSAISSDSTKVHLLARIFLGSVCLIWSGLSQLGFLTGGSGNDRWSKEGKLHEETNGLGSFMAAMGYDLERLNGSGGGDKTGQFVQKLLSGTDPSGKDGIQWKEFQGDSATKGSVAEYYSEIYEKAKEAAKSTTESICKDYPLLVLHILASGYFRAGSAGANKVPVAPSAPSSDPRKPRTIREILYWLSALPYSQGYKALVERMQQKYPRKEGKPQETATEIVLHGEQNGNTTLKRDCITHYLMAACGYCPLVLISIQGTIATSGIESAPATGAGGVAAGTAENKCTNYGKKKEEKTDCNKDNELTKQGKVCYRGYHLAVKDFGPLHGMYANGLFGFQMDLSAAQCLDQLRVYVYHCFYQLYFLRKQCGAGVTVDKKAVLGWQSCRYGYQVSTRKGGNTGGADTKNWMCSSAGNSNGNNQGGSPNQNNGQSNKCNCLGEGATQGKAGTPGDGSPLQSFLCDSINGMHCGITTGSGVDRYPPIEDHMNCPAGTVGHFGGPPKHCPVPMGWSAESTSGSGSNKENHFKGTNTTYPAHCTGNTLSLLLEYYCDPGKCHGTLVVLLRLLACITPTVPRTLGDLFGFYYYIVYIGGKSGGSGKKEVYTKLGELEKEVLLHMRQGNEVVQALTTWSTGGDCSKGNEKNLKCLTECTTGTGAKYLSPLSGQQYGQLSPLMAGTYLSWLVYLIEGFQEGLQGLVQEYKNIGAFGATVSVTVARNSVKWINGVVGVPGGAAGGCNGDTCRAGSHGDTCKSGGNQGVCGCSSVVSCTGVLPVLYKYGFGYGDVSKLHPGTGVGDSNKKCHDFLGTLEKVLRGDQLDSTKKGLHHEINQLIYTTRLPWIFVLTLAWLVAVLYLAFGAIWPLDWTHMRSHCRGWFGKGSLSPWEVLMVGKKKGRGILEFFGKT
uniref:Variant erythrocyte surface antigen-1, beta subunit n=1 Tax=Babesia bovis TaxID=5865 RepID=A7AUL8_BABBO|eukprot:XP_001610197.1 variant erythrocyte surface antigen-1, beta subunit [Babesia bovis T2Bo]